MSVKDETTRHPPRVAETVVPFPLPHAARLNRVPRRIELLPMQRRVGLRARPGQHYRLPDQAAEALVAAECRDLVLRFPDGSALVLQHVVTVEAMTDPPVLRLGGRAVPASVLAFLALTQPLSPNLDSLIDLAEAVFAFHGPSAFNAAAALLCGGSGSD